MRIFWFVCCAVLLAVAAWLQLRSAPREAPPSAPAVTAPADPSAAPRADPPSHHSDASAAVRAPRRAEADVTPAAKPIASARAPAPTRRPPAADPGDAQTGEDAAAKPAGELFVPFIADDPGKVFAPATVQYHAALQGETQDPAWGPAVENALRGYFGQFGERFEIPYVDCRQDLCELQVASRIGGDLQRDMHDAQEAMQRMKQEPWWTTLEIDQESGTVGSSADGRMLLLWFFSRK